MIKYYVLMITSVLVASFSQVLLKKSANIKYDNFIKEYLNVYVIFGYGLMFLSTIFALLAYKGLELKYGSIIDSLGYVFVLILASIFFKEKITKNKIIGNLLIIVGVILFCI